MKSNGARPSVGVNALGLENPHRTGVGNHVLHLVRHLSSYGDELDLHVFGRLPEDLVLPASVRIHPIDTPGLLARLREDLWGVGRRVSRLGLDLLHCPKSLLPFRYSGSGSLTVHDLIFLKHPDAYDRIRRFFWRNMLSWSLRRARGIVAVSDATKNDLVKFFPVEPDRITVIPNGVDPRRFQPSPTEPTEVDLPGIYGIDEPYFLYLGGFYRRKNLHRLLDAYAIAHETSGPLPLLVLAGPGGDERGPLEQQARNRNVRDRVKFPGYIPDAHLPALYRSARRFVFPSLDEGFGIPILEALCSGCPVICSNVPSLREVGGRHVEYFDPFRTEEMANVLAHSQEPKPVPDRVRTRLLKTYSWKHVVEQYYHYFRRLSPP